MARNYDELLGLAAAYLSFTGYLDSDGIGKRDRALKVFAQARRVFVFEALKDAVDPQLLAAQVDHELSILQRRLEDGIGEFDFLRAELGLHILKLGRNTWMMRLVTRWIVPVGSLLGIVAYLAIKFWVIGRH